MTVKSRAVFSCCLFFIPLLHDMLTAGGDGYFQQYVRYRMIADLNTEDHTVSVAETLLYRNQSPDTLDVLYFNLYLNKFRKSSLALPDLKEQTGGIDIREITLNHEKVVVYQVDETLMHLPLGKVLAPGDSVLLAFLFDAIIPPANGRFGYQGMHYDIGNWYITPVVYDRFGWHLHQHLDNEFYQEWGDFRVTIRVPQDFFVGATGDLLNENEVVPLAEVTTPEWLRVDHADSILIPWEFEAHRVHDFAWTTDPSYIRKQVTWNGITLNILILDYNEKSWQEVAEWGGKALEYFSKTFGMYPYKQLTVADTYIRAGGIEYPQIVMINDYINPDFEPGEFRAVIVHEMAHNWFYGLLGNNQLEHEWMDEGFATFAEIKVMEYLFGREGNLATRNRGWFVDNFGFENDDRRENLLSYLTIAKYNLEQDPIDLHADYLGPSGYTLEYSKAANVLFLLEYTLGDSVFNHVMHRYFDLWHYRHPSPENFIKIAGEASGCDLYWFFEEWLKTDRKLDYAINDVCLITDADSLKYTVSLRRKEKIFMPVDLEVILEDGSVRNYWIPTERFTCQRRDRKLLPYWHFSRDTYTAQIVVPEKIRRIAIAPGLTQMDINQLDNVYSLIPPLNWTFMHIQHFAPPTDAYLWEVWPLVFYNDIDKIKLGVNLKGSYLGIDHVSDLRVWFKTATLNIDFDLNYKNPVDWFGNISWLTCRGFALDGREGASLGLLSNLSPGRRAVMTAGLYFNLHHLSDPRYLTAPWDPGWVSTINLGWKYEHDYDRWTPKALLKIGLDNSGFGSDYDFSMIYLEGRRKFWDEISDLELDLRMFGGYGVGDIPVQYSFNLSGDNSWGEFNNDFYRARGSLPWPWRRNGNLYKAGGGNVRGYSLSRDQADLLGSRILALNCDLKLPNPLRPLGWPVLEDIYPGLFVDFGNVWDRAWPSVNEFHASAGFALSWEVWDWLDYFFNMRTVRIDFPIWLNHPADGDPGLDFRWLIRFDFETAE